MTIKWILEGTTDKKKKRMDVGVTEEPIQKKILSLLSSNKFLKIF